jgi:hypothetical protein
MRPKKPTHILIDQVRITREGNEAIIDPADENVSGARIAIGAGIATMTDADIVEMYNDISTLSGRSWTRGTRRSSKNRRARSRSTTTRTAINGSRAATCSAASSTTAVRTGKLSSALMIKSCRWRNSSACGATSWRRSAFG